MEDTDLGPQDAKLAYTIIQSLLDGHEALGDLLVVMSHALDEDTLKALTQTSQWERYLESKRNLTTAQEQIQKFTDILRGMDEGESR